MDKSVDIHKAGGAIVQNRRLLVARSRGKTSFNTPGGKLEEGETARQALIRELFEEGQIKVEDHHLQELGTFYDTAADHTDKTFRMDVFLVKDWVGNIVPDNEIEELRWVNSQDIDNIKLGPVFRNHIVPHMKAADLID